MACLRHGLVPEYAQRNTFPTLIPLLAEHSVVAIIQLGELPIAFLRVATCIPCEPIILTIHG